MMTLRAQSAFGSIWSIRLLFRTDCVMTRYIVAHYLWDDPWDLGLPATVNRVCVKMVPQIVVVDCLYDDP